MKKILILTLLVLISVFSNNSAHATTTDTYVNLLESSNLCYTESTDTISAKNYIPLKGETIYTFVASWEFFGDTTASKKTALVNKKLGTIFKDAEGANLPMSMNIYYNAVGLYYAQFVTTQSCELLFTDLLVTGTTLDELLLDQYIFYEGSRYDFKGFKKTSDFTGYNKLGEEVTIYTDYDNPITLDTIKENLKVYDANDGDIDINEVSIEDNYTGNLSVGEHEIIFAVDDQGENEGSLKVIVNVLDVKAPVIGGKVDITWNMSNACPTIDDLRSNFTVTDNADNTLSIEDIYISSSELGNYQQNILTQYLVTFAVKDASSNIGYLPAVIQTIDEDKPVVVLQNVEIKLSEVGNSLFRDLYKKVIVSVTDNAGDPSLGFAYTELYGNGGYSGLIEVTIKAVDSSGNQTLETAMVTIVDDIAPEFYFKAEALETSIDKPYTPEGLKQAIRRRLDARGILYDEVNLISSNYFNSEDVEGVYSVKYAYSYDGKINYEIADINVVKNQFNYAWLCLLLIPAGVISGWLFFRKRKKCLN